MSIIHSRWLHTERILISTNRCKMEMTVSVKAVLTLFTEGWLGVPGEV